MLLNKTKPWGKSGLEQNESSRAYHYLFKTINQSQCLLRQFQEEYKRARSGFLTKKVLKSSVRQARSSFYMYMKQGALS